MGPGAAAFQTLIRHLTPGLEARGFERHGNVFSRRADGNVVAIESQRSPDSTSTTYVFFVNLGVVSRLVHLFEKGMTRVPDVPREYHWWARLGEIIPTRAPWGWRIERLDDAEPMAEGILEALDEHGIPLLSAQASDETLLKEWAGLLESSSDGDIKPLLLLSILAVAYESRQLADRTMAKLKEECEGFPCASLVDAHARRLAQWKPMRSQMSAVFGRQSIRSRSQFAA